MSGVIQIIIDDSTDKTITGQIEWDRANGGILVLPGGTTFPGSPIAGEYFVRTDELKIYRRNDANTAWVVLAGSAPSAHADTHKSGGSDEIDLDELGTPSDNTDLNATTSAHGLCPKGSGSATQYLDGTLNWSTPAGGGGGQTDTVTGSNGITNTGDNVDAVIAPTYGSSANTICQGNDSRLSDARTPTAHASSHQSGGSDSIKLDDLASPDDNTDLNASSSAHGLCPKLSGVSTEFLNGTGAFSTPSGGSSAAIKYPDNTYFPEYYDSGLTLRTVDPITPGNSIRFIRPGTMRGVRFRTIDTNSTTFRAKLWNGTTEVASGTLATSAAGMYDIIFSSPYTITEGMLGDTFYVSVYDTVNEYTTYSTTTPPGSVQAVGIGWFAIDGMPKAYRNGDDSAAPTLAASTSRFPIAPLYEIKNVESTYGECYVSSASGTTISTSGTYVKIAGTYAAGELSDFTHAAGVLTYTGDLTKTYKITAVVSVTADSTDTYKIRLAKNGTSIAKTEMEEKVNSSDGAHTVTVTGLIELATDDTLEIQVTDTSVAGAVLTANKAVLNAID